MINLALFEEFVKVNFNWISKNVESQGKLSLSFLQVLKEILDFSKCILIINKLFLKIGWRVLLPMENRVLASSSSGSCWRSWVWLLMSWTRRTRRSCYTTSCCLPLWSASWGLFWVSPSPCTGWSEVWVSAVCPGLLPILSTRLQLFSGGFSWESITENTGSIPVR